MVRLAHQKFLDSTPLSTTYLIIEYDGKNSIELICLIFVDDNQITHLLFIRSDYYYYLSFHFRYVYSP